MKQSGVIRKSISLSRAVSDWADELSHKKGFGTNFSAYIADLVRKDKERESHTKLPLPGQLVEASSMKEIAEKEIAVELRKAAQKGASASRRKK